MTNTPHNNDLKHRGNSQRMTEEAVRESEERLKTVLEGIAEAFYVLDQHWCFLFANRSALKMWNKDLEDILGRPFLECFPQAAGSEAYQMHRQVMSTRVADRLETVSPVLNRWIEVDISPTERGVLAVAFRDIDARKRADLALRESEEKYRTLFNSMDEGFAVIDLILDDKGEPVDTFHLEANPAYERHTGINNIVGKRGLEVIPSIGEWLNFYGDIARTGEPKRLEYYVEHIGRWLTCYVSRVGDEGSLRLAVVFNDITDRKNAEKVLMDSEQKLREFNATLEQQAKLRIVELRNLISKQKDLEEEQQKEIFRTILHTQEEERKRIAESLHNSLGQMLYAAKLSLGTIDKKPLEDNEREMFKKADRLLSDAINESRRLSHELMPVILQDFGLKTAVEDICSKLSEKVRFKLKFKGTPNSLDKSIEVAIFRLVQELMMNVVKHSGASGAMVAIEVYAERIMVLVHDNGKGFKTDNIKSGGIGLKAIRNNVSLLNGNMNIVSSPGYGTIVNIDIPLT